MRGKGAGPQCSNLIETGDFFIADSDAITESGPCSIWSKQLETALSKEALDAHAAVESMLKVPSIIKEAGILG